jgi:radical SAM superfamily enzyme YgiQ (UPF0313 family)
VLLVVSCYELGHQPLYVASAAAHLERAGLVHECIDLSIDRLDESQVRRAERVAIAAPMHTALRIGVEVAERVRALNAGAKICFFGLYAPLLEGTIAADAFFGGEFEAALVAWAQGADAARENERTMKRPAYLAPSRRSLPTIDRYARLVIGDERRVAGYVEASRGCLHMCTHCPIPPIYGGRFFAVPVEVVLADVAALVAAGARHVTFGDADFLNGPKHALAVARGVAAAHPGITFDCTVKVEHILAHADVWPELRALGCVFVVSAVESLSDRILAILDKGHTAADVDRALAIVRGAGISLRPTFVPFTPWTTLEDVLALCHFIQRHELEAEVDPVQLTIRLLLPPGSLLLERHPELRGAVDPVRLAVPWVHADARVDRLQEELAALVERSINEDPTTTFAAIHDVVARAAGRSFTPRQASSRRAAPPRLSEPWFC